MLKIRPANKEDAPHVARIYVESWNTGFVALMPPKVLDEERVARWQQELSYTWPYRRWVVGTDAKIVGFTEIGLSRDTIEPNLGELDTIALDPGHWRSGIGRDLMKIALKYLECDGYRKAILWTLANYERGQRFYEAMGWRADGGIRDENRQVRYRIKFILSRRERTKVRERRKLAKLPQALHLSR